MESPVSIETLDEAKEVEAKILDAADKAAAWITESGLHGLDLIEKMKFEHIGFHPISHAPLNLIEQVNQTFTCLASVRAVEQLFDIHSDVKGFVLNMAEQAGSDIESIDGSIAAEVFAATKPSSNQKLKKDIAKVGRATAQWRYVFFASPGYQEGRHKELEKDDVQVWAVAI